MDDIISSFSLTQYVDFYGGFIYTVDVFCSDSIEPRIFPWGITQRNFSVVVFIFDLASSRWFQHFVSEDPANDWRRFTLDVNVKFDRLSGTNSNLLKFLTVDPGFAFEGKKMKNFQIWISY